ncbi:Tat pathway signal sequence domain protein, partial [Streptomyces alfalfae]
MRETVRRHLGKVVAGAAVAAAGTAVLVGVALPGAGAGESGGRQANAAAQEQDCLLYTTRGPGHSKQNKRKNKTRQKNRNYIKKK